MSACRAAASLHVLLEVLQVLLILGQDNELSFGASRLPGLPHGGLFENQFRQGLIIPGNYQLLAWCELFNQFRQLGPSLLNGNGWHGSLLHGSLSCACSTYRNPTAPNRGPAF